MSAERRRAVGLPLTERGRQCRMEARYLTATLRNDVEVIAQAAHGAKCALERGSHEALRVQLVVIRTRAVEAERALVQLRRQAA